MEKRSAESAEVSRPSWVRIFYGVFSFCLDLLAVSFCPTFVGWWSLSWKIFLGQKRLQLEELIDLETFWNEASTENVICTQRISGSPPHPHTHQMKRNHMMMITGDIIDALQLDHLPALWMRFGPFGSCAIVVHG